VKDPEKYLKTLGIDPPDVVDPSKNGIIDSSMRITVNFEFYYFSGRATMKRFLQNPLRYCGYLTDPVTMWRFKPTAKSPKTEYLNRTYYFSADSTRARFLEAPDRFQDRKSGSS
jgi:YHS domain-containing protein